MEPGEATILLERTSLNDETDIEQIVLMLIENAEGPISEVVYHWATGEHEMTEKAKKVLAGLADLSIGVLLNRQSTNDPTKMAWKIRNIISGQIQRRKEIHRQLKDFLNDRSVTPNHNPVGLPIEEIPIENRVCDIAYTELRRLVGPDKDESIANINNELYFRLEFSQRDRYIELLKSDNVWINEPMDPFLTDDK